MYVNILQIGSLNVISILKCHYILIILSKYLSHYQLYQIGKYLTNFQCVMLTDVNLLNH